MTRVRVTCETCGAVLVGDGGPWMLLEDHVGELDGQGWRYKWSPQSRFSRNHMCPECQEEKR